MATSPEMIRVETTGYKSNREGGGGGVVAAVCQVLGGLRSDGAWRCEAAPCHGGL